MRYNKPYIKLREYAVKALENNWAFSSPFADFDIFEDLGIDDDDLLQMFFDKFGELKIGKALPPKDFKVIYNMQVVKLETEQLRWEYIWSWMVSVIKDYLAANAYNWEKKVDALTTEYKPLENYNMVEHTGATSVSSRIRSSQGTVKNTSKVAPFDSESFKNESEVTSTQGTLNGSDFHSDAGITGYDSDTKTLTFDDMTTPQGNATAVSKLTRSGNIGVTTSQQMLESELELRKVDLVNDFFKEIVKVALLSEWK